LTFGTVSSRTGDERDSIVQILTEMNNVRRVIDSIMQDDGAVLADASQVRDLSLESIRTRPAHSTAVLVDPRFFDREYVINPHMGGEVDHDRAREQWEHLREVYERTDADVRVLDPTETARRLERDGGGPDPTDRPDMVFVANHAVPTADGAGVVLARMATDERAGEPDHFRAWAERRGYRVEDAPAAVFEGMGDALWHPGRRLLWGGYGVRTERSAYDELAARLDATVVPLELTDERYYHLDVSLAPLSATTALVEPEAFTDEGLAKVEAAFETVLEAPTDESADGLSVNLEVVGETVIMGSGSPETAALLEDEGFDVVTVETSEFLKAGGSVCCLTLSLGVPPTGE
jgi:N-dimethylarginine dimethylaminohydrolase